MIVFFKMSQFLASIHVTFFWEQQLFFYKTCCNYSQVKVVPVITYNMG